MGNQGDHSDGHGQLGELRTVGILVLFKLEDISLWSVSKMDLITSFRMFFTVVTAMVLKAKILDTFDVSCPQVSPISLLKSSGWSTTPQELQEICRAT